MLFKPKPHYDEQRRVAIGYKNPLYMSKAKQVQPTLYSGQEIVKPNHAHVLVHDSEDTLKIDETTRKQMNEKNKRPRVCEKEGKYFPYDYSKENYLATFTPQKQLTPEQIFWCKDLIKMKAEALQEQTQALRPIKALMVYPPNTPATLVLRVVQIVLWYLDSGCSKHMTGDRSWLRNFVKKFIGTVRFGNDHFGDIMGYGDYVIGDSVISRVYYVEGLGHNLFFIKQFCDFDLEVAFRKHSCYVRDTNGVELIKGSRGSNLYTISVEDMMKSSLIWLLSKASKNKSWLWHRRLNHLNFADIGTFVSYAPSRKGYRIYNKRTRRIMENIRVQFDELSEPIAPMKLSTGPTPTFLSLDKLVQEPPRVGRPVFPVLAVPVPVNSTGTPSSTTIDQDAPPPSHSPSSLALQSPSSHQSVAA
uniref:Integrase, catalytic region, zinc finger, CCHC-type, peptidase aspartic, catalytic n=1 Tax=Tanacetum cinerariifolium TaxID=118510 RepID=A0A6L2N1H2_TANCI|nr:integrase, catalytic region, zinc finger, CCHC-type, peptidase aspartic, catalytic [Tanacetum cinerariifolium]